MIPDLVTRPAALAWASTDRLRGVARRRTHRALQPGDRLEVVVEHVGPDVEQQPERIERSLGVGDQRLDRGAGPDGADRLDAAGDVGHPAVGEIVAGDHRQHDVVEIHATHRLGDARRLVECRRQRLACVDEAEAAGAGAAVTEQHQRRRAVGPAFRQVRAAGVLAHGDEPELAHAALEPHHLRAEMDLGSQPVGLASLDRQSRR